MVRGKHGISCDTWLEQELVGGKVLCCHMDVIDDDIRHAVDGEEACWSGESWSLVDVFPVVNELGEILFHAHL